MNNKNLLRFDRADKTVGVNVDSSDRLVDFARWLENTDIDPATAQAVAHYLLSKFVAVKDQLLALCATLVFGYIQNYSIEIFAVATGTTTVSFSSSGEVINPA